METRTLLQEKRDEILKIAAEHGASNVRVFGSVLRGNESPDSDIDLLVDMEPERSLLDHVALKQDLERLLGFTIDVTTEDSLHPAIREALRQDLRALVPRDEMCISSIRECLDRIGQYTTTEAAFLNSALVRDAVARNVELISQGVKRLSPDFKTRHPGLAWQRISNALERLGAGQPELDRPEIWAIATSEELNNLRLVVNET